jgi:hypothetical protein
MCKQIRSSIAPTQRLCSVVTLRRSARQYDVREASTRDSQTRLQHVHSHGAGAVPRPAGCICRKLPVPPASASQRSCAMSACFVGLGAPVPLCVCACVRERACVCGCVCVCVCACVCVSARARVRAWACARAWVCARVRACLRACVYAQGGLRGDDEWVVNRRPLTRDRVSVPSVNPRQHLVKHRPTKAMADGRTGQHTVYRRVAVHARCMGRPCLGGGWRTVGAPKCGCGGFGSGGWGNATEAAHASTSPQWCTPTGDNRTTPGSQRSPSSR